MGGFFFQEAFSLIIPCHTLISKVFISETLSLFFCGDFISTVCISETLSLFFFVGISSQQFAFQKPYPYFFCGDFTSAVCISETLPLFFGGVLDLNSFHFRNLIPIFLVVWISTVFISETFFLFSEMKTVEIHTAQKNRGKASEMQTVEMKTLQKIGRRFLK